MQLTQRQLEILTSDIALQITRYGYKCPSQFETSKDDDQKDISTGDLYSLLCDLRKALSN